MERISGEIVRLRRGIHFTLFCIYRWLFSFRYLIRDFFVYLSLIRRKLWLEWVLKLFEKNMHLLESNKEPIYPIYDLMTECYKIDTTIHGYFFTYRIEACTWKQPLINMKFTHRLEWYMKKLDEIVASAWEQNPNNPYIIKLIPRISAMKKNIGFFMLFSSNQN